MTRILLVRHGQIKANKTGHWHGSTDSKLTWTGKRQARRTGRHLRANHNVAAVYSSPMRRCRETAEAFGLPVEPVVDDDLREMSIGEWETMSFRELAREYNFMRRITEDPGYRAPRGESLGNVANRVEATLNSIDDRHEPDDTVVVVSHGVAMAAALSSILNGTTARWTDYRFRNCSLTELALSPEPALFRIDDYAHL